MILLPGAGDVALDGVVAGGPAFAAFAAAAIALRDALQNEPLDAGAIRPRLLDLAGLAKAAADAAASAMGAEPPVSDAPTEDTDVIYDRYFGVARSEAAMPRAQFAGYAAAAWADVFADMPETLLGRDELAAFLAGVCTTCAWLGLGAAA